MTGTVLRCTDCGIPIRKNQHYLHKPVRDHKIRNCICEACYEYLQPGEQSQYYLEKPHRPSD